MMTGVEEILLRCRALGLPIAKNAFQGTLEDPVPPMPYLVYLLPHEKRRGADFRNNLIKESDFDLELYTEQDDEEREKLQERIQGEILFDVEHEVFVAPVDGEDCFQTAFEIRGIVEKVKGVKNE